MRGPRHWVKTLAMRWSRTAQYAWGGYYVGGYGYSHGEYGNVSYSDASVVMAPVLWLMRTLPEAPVTIDRFRNGAWEQEVDHPMVQLLRRPNEYCSGDLLMQATVMSLAFDGDAYWIKVTDRQLRVTELWWVPNESIEPKWPRSGNDYISHYEYNPGGGDPVILAPQEVVHLRWGIDPENVRCGLSPLASVLREIGADEEAARFAMALLGNMGVPGLVVAPAAGSDVVVSDDDLDASKVALEEAFTGSRRGKPFVAGAPTTVQQFGFTPQQMDMRTLRRVPEERVSAVLGVPAIVAGLGAGLDRSTFSNFAEAREAAYDTAVIPLQRLITAELEHQLLVDFEPGVDLVRCRFDLSNVRILQEDANALVDRKLKELGAGAITLGMYLRETGREAGPEHDVYLRQFSVVEIPADQLGQGSVVEGVGRAGGQAVAARRGGGQKARPTNDQVAWMAELERQLPLHAAKLIDPLVATFDQIGEEAAAAYLSLTKQRKVAKDPHLDEPTVEEILKIVRAGEITSPKMRELLKTHYGQMASATVETFNGFHGLAVNLPDYVMRGIIEKGGTRAGLVDVEHSLRERLYVALAEGRALGEGPREVAKRIRDEVPAGRFVNAGPKYRAELIARTETKYAQNISALESYKVAGADKVLAFDAQGGGVSDPECEARDGAEFTLTEADSELSTEHPNGTLSFAPIFSG